MPTATHRFWVIAVLWGALAVAWGQDKPAPLAVWNGKSVEHVGKERGVSAPLVVHPGAPVFTESARGKRLPPPLVALVVDTEGLPQNIHIVKTSGNAEYDAHFMEAVKQYRFKPAMKDGKPVQVELAIEEDMTIF